MDKEKLAELIKASNGVVITMTKFANVLSEFTDSIIHEGNAPSAPTVPTAQSAPAVPTVPTAPSGPAVPSQWTIDESVGLDGEGRPWCKEVHASTKTQVNSKVIKGAKAFRVGKGVDDALLEAFYNDHPVSTAPAAPTAPSAPTLPTAPMAPTLPTAPSAVDIEEKDPNEEIRNKIIMKIKTMTDVIGFDWGDIKEIFVEEFKTTQNGDQVVFGSIPTEQYPVIEKYLSDLVNQYELAETMIKKLYEIVGPANRSSVDTPLADLYKAYNTDMLSGVHYTQIKAVNDYLNTWLKSWS